MSLLLLGGTGDARQLADSLHRRGVPLVYSIAGLVDRPRLECPVISGGFRQFGGLQRYLSSHRISAVLDATHPFAQRISDSAAAAARSLAIPCWRLLRPRWMPQAGDDWRLYRDWPTLLPALARHCRPLITVGQPPTNVLQQLHAAAPHQRQWFRAATAARNPLPSSAQWIEDRGPFSTDAELALMRRHRIDALVSKHSGGAATAAKLRAARALGVPVYLLARPPLRPVDREFSCIDHCVDHVQRHYQ